MMTSSIAIPVTDCRGEKNLKDLDELLASIEPDRSHFKEVIGLFDSCEWVFVKYFQEKYSWLSIVWNKTKAYNFTKNANVGLRLCHQELKTDCFLVNQDCVFGGWFNDAKDLLKIRNKGISTPMSAQASIGPVFNIKGSSTKRFPFYCTYFSTESMDKVGYLDDVFIKVYSDTDYVARCLLAGLPVEEFNMVINHKGSHIDTSGDWISGSGCYSQNDLNLGLAQFKTKWQADVDDSVIMDYIINNHKWKEEMKCL